MIVTSSLIQVGTARSQPGQIVYGRFDAVALPTGGFNSFPVIIAQGRSKGPVLWLTGNIHGGEYDGLAVIHQFFRSNILDGLKGTVVAIPTLSPAGLRVGERSPYYLRGKDPNRLFPGLPGADDHEDVVPPSALELAYERLFETIDATADYLLDFHNYGIQSIPFALRDPIFYREPRDKPVARKLQETVGEMLQALGLTIINEYASDRYLRMNLHRSVSGAALNRARIPAVTVEVGGQLAVNTGHVRAVVVGIRNMMRWAGMLAGSPEPLPPEFPIIRPNYAMRRTTHPRVPEACLVYHLVQPGDAVRAGDPVAHMADIYGRPVGAPDGLLRTEYDGFVMGIFPGIAFYPNEAIIGLAVRDEGDLIVQAPRRW